MKIENNYVGFHGLHTTKVPYFAAKFCGTCLVLLSLAVLLPESTWQPLNLHTATMANRLLGMCGMHPVQHGTILGQGGFRVQIISECTVLYMAILLSSFILSSPAGIYYKLMGLVACIAGLHAINIVRIAVVYALGVAYPQFFEIAHVYLGQIVMVVLVMAACLFWMHMLEPDAISRRRTTTFLIRLLTYTGILFLFWLMVNKDYVRLTDTIVLLLFSLLDYHLRLNYQHAFYYQTFNLVIFSALMLAMRDMPPKRRIIVSACGLVLIVGLHIVFRICNVLMFLRPSGNMTAFRVSQLIFISGEYLLPVCAWLFLQRKIFGGAPAQGAFSAYDFET